MNLNLSNQYKGFLIQSLMRNNIPASQAIASVNEFFLTPEGQEGFSKWLVKYEREAPPKEGPVSTEELFFGFAEHYDPIRPQNDWM